MFIFGYDAEVDELNPAEHHLVCVVAELADEDSLQEVHTAGLPQAQAGEWVLYAGSASDPATTPGCYYGPWATAGEACAFGQQHCGVVQYLEEPADDLGIFGNMTDDDEDELDELQ